MALEVFGDKEKKLMVAMLERWQHPLNFPILLIMHLIMCTLLTCTLLTRLIM